MKKIYLAFYSILIALCVNSISEGTLPLNQGYVHFIYLSPTDEYYKPYYEKSILNAALNLQEMFASVRSGSSFSLAADPVTWFPLPRESEYYKKHLNSTWFWDAVVGDTDSLIQSGSYDVNDVWIIFADIDLPYFEKQGGEPSRVILPNYYIRGLVGEYGDVGDDYYGLGFREFGEYVEEIFDELYVALWRSSFFSYDYNIPEFDIFETSLDNGGFEGGVDSWIFYTNGVVDSGNIMPGFVSSFGFGAYVQERGTNTQLIQSDICLEPNQEYLLVFSGYCNTKRDIGVSLSNEGYPYVDYGLNRRFDRFNMMPYWKTFAHRFTTKGFASTVCDGKLFFWLADDLGTYDRYWFDDIKLLPLAFDDEGGPSGLKVVKSTDVKIILTWRANRGGEDLAYFVYRDGEYVGSTDKNVYADFDLNPSSIYTYQVRRVDQLGVVSDLSDSIDAATLPSFNLIKNGDFQQGSVYWPIGEDQIIRDTEGVTSFNKWASICKYGLGGELLLHQKDIGLFPETSYRLSFRARSELGDDIEVTLNQGLENAWVNLGTDWQEFTLYFTTPSFGTDVYEGYVLFELSPNDRPTQCYEFDRIVLTQIDPANVGPLDPPTTLQTNMCSESIVCLSWEAPTNNPGGLGYFVYRNGVEIGTTTETKFVDYNLELDQFYYYSVSAFDLIGRESIMTSVKQVATPGTELAGINLIQNGNFEKGMSHWKGYELQAYSSGIDPYEGDRCGRVYFPLAPSNARMSQSDIVLEADTEYNLSFFIRSNRAANNKIVLNITSSSYSCLVGVCSPVSYAVGLDHLPVDVTTEWRVYCVTFEMPPAFGPDFLCTLNLHFRDSAGLLGSYSLDQVCLVKKGQVEALTYRP